MKNKVKKEFKKYNPIGIEEIRAVNKVLKTGVLSGFVATKGEDFLGGKKVKEFESKCCKYFKVKYAISVNSWSSGLTIAMGAIGLEPGDEVIVSPWTMCASASSIIHWNAIPVFADIEKNTFCVDPNSVEHLITKKTKAILSVDIFGQSAAQMKLKKIAKKYKLKLISDTAQSPGSLYNKKFSGTLSDIGGFSLNHHKHIHTGEGGVLFTNNKKLAHKMQLLRNHAEAVMDTNDPKELNNMVGHNYRMGEIEAAIGIEQIKKLKKIIIKRQKLAKLLSKGIKNLLGLKIPVIRKQSTHVYYVYPLIISFHKLGIKRKNLLEKLKNEGVQGLMSGYQNLHLLPMYQNKIAYGTKGFPWTVSKNKISYKKGICPVAENLNDFSFVGLQMCLFDYTVKDINFIIKAFKKVWIKIINSKN